MKLISHRGNIQGPLPHLENSMPYIQGAIDLGHDVEIDVRLIKNKLFLGHDKADYEVSLKWLVDRKNNLWVHTKNFAALDYLISHDLRIFYHQKEDHTIINNCNLIWSHNLSEASEKSIIPLISLDDIDQFDFLKLENIFDICSDYIDCLKILIG